jgi:hypothetical protein
VKPAEVAILLEQFRREVKPLKGNALLDRWLAFEGTPDSKVPDLGLQKTLCLEAFLIKEFGIEWRDAIEDRREAKKA